MNKHREPPDWPPTSSAGYFKEGERRYGSTGQLFEVRNQQWVRVQDDHKPHMVDKDPAQPGGHC